MRKLHCALAVMILGIVPPAAAQDAKGSFFHHPQPAPVSPPPVAAPAPPAVVEVSPSSSPLSPLAAPPSAMAPVIPQSLFGPVSPPPIRSETQPVIDKCGSNSGAVAQFVRSFFATGSGSVGAVLSYQQLIYAEQVDYYGKATSKTVILKQKEAYLNRWPARTYTLRGSGDIQCDEVAKTYDFAGLVDWTASSPVISNGAVKRGTAAVRLGILASSINSFKIVKESSEVIERHQ